MTQSATKQSALSTTHQPNVTVTQWLEKLSSAFHSNTPSDAAFLFEEDGYWRDLVAFTWNIKTLEGRTAIRDMINETVSHVRPTNWQLDEDATEKDGVIDAWITFDTAVAKGRAYLRLRDGLAWTFLTTMVELTDYPEKRNKRRPKGAEHGANKNRQTWLEKRQHEETALGYTEQPYCLIIGGGQGVI